VFQGIIAAISSSPSFSGTHVSSSSIHTRRVCFNSWKKWKSWNIWDMKTGKGGQRKKEKEYSMIEEAGI
jgi:hypothetical protein